MTNTHSLIGDHMTPLRNANGDLVPLTGHGKNYVTWKDGKHQLRRSLRAHGFRVHGHFRMRKENRNEFQCIAVRDNKTYQVNAERTPGALINLTHLG